MDDKIKLLIIEDEALIAENLKLTLEDLGYEVTGTYYHFNEARQAILRGGVDLILLDINLANQNPDENGLALAALIQATHPIPFIFLTAYQDKKTILKATQLRPSAYLIKPANSSAVFAAIQMALAHQQHHQTTPPTQPQSSPDYFFVKLGHQTHKLQWQDVYCMEASKNYVLLRLVNRRLVYPIRGTLTFVISQLVPTALQSSFIRINRSTVLNKAYIRSYTVDKIMCQDDYFENTRFTLRQLQELTQQN